MAEVSIQDAAFTGFRVVREHPMALPAWIGLSIVFNLALQAILIGMAGPALTQLTGLMASMTAHPGKLDWAAFSSIAPGLLPAYGLMLPLSFAFNAVLYAAMNRAVLRPAESALGYLRLGVDELRQFGLQFILGLLFFGLYFVGVLILATVVALAQGAGVLIAVFGGLAAVCGFVFLGVRLSLAAPATFQTGKIDLAASWSLTQGRFWPVFATFLLALVLAMVILVLASIVTGVVTVLVSMAGLGLGAATPQPSEMFTMAGFLTPLRLISLVLNAAAGALMWPILLTPAAGVYQQLTRNHGAAAAEAFS